MRTETGVIPGGALDEDLCLIGVANSSIVVPSGLFLQLNGVVKGDLIVQAGGQAEINGVVNGNLRNEGGSAIVRGVVQGAVVDSGASSTEIAVGAIVQGIRR